MSPARRDRHRLVVAAVALFWMACQPSPAPTPAGPVIETRSGRVQGTWENGVRVYRGLPYAAPPVGSLRWHPPGPAPVWDGVRQAKEFGSACPQPRLRDDQSEDCLFLNIWTPEDATASSRLPVLVWVHGGGFLAGRGDDEDTRGDAFAREGVVVVSFNYRLGALGFLAHPLLEEEQSGRPRANYGLLDMLAALGWVQRNIASFGGDPSSVTIFGHSAGGMAVHLLMVVPEARGLFHRAIGMSGFGTWPLPRLAAMDADVVPEGDPTAEATGLEIIERATMGATLRSVDELRAIPAERLAGAVEGLHRPIVDGQVLPDEPGILFARGEQHDVPLISGGASYDGTVFGATGASVEDYLASWGPHRAQVRALYSDDFSVSDEQGAARLFGDSRYLLGGRTLVRAMDRVSSPGWLYYYSFIREARRGETPGAPHGAMVRPLFDHEEDAEAAERGRLMRAYWINLARTGDPNGPGLPPWPRHDAEEDRWLVLDETTQATAGVIRERLDFLERRYRERVGS